jgi:uncharacterized protein (TIGR02118 family)
MPFQLTVMYNHPADPAAFDRYYAEVHAPIAAKIPGVQALTVFRPAAALDGTPPPYHAVVTLLYEDEVAMATAMATPEAHAAVADMDNFAQAGAVMMSGPTRTVR